MLLIVNADDYALTQGVSKGITEAHEVGIIKSTTMLANTEHFDYAVSLLRSVPNLGVGVHLNLTLGRPVCDGLKSLVDRRGCFLKPAEFKMKEKNIDFDEMVAEFSAQVDKIQKAGVEVTHVDTHNHIHVLPRVCEAVTIIAEKYDICARKADGLPDTIKTTEEVTNAFVGSEANDMSFKMLVKKYEKFSSLEIMCRPGFCDLELITNSKYNKKREMELSVLSRYELKFHLEKSGIKLIHYGQL